MVTRKVFYQFADVLLGDGGARKATKYFSPTLVAKATRRHKGTKRDRTTEILVTIGRPNYAERKFIKTALAAGEQFPIKGIQLKFYPTKA